MEQQMLPVEQLTALEEKGFTQLPPDPGVIECYQRLPEDGPTFWS